METINVFEWFLKTNVDGELINPVAERVLEVVMIFSITDYSELTLSNYQYIGEKEIRFETLSIRRLKDKHEIKVSVYIDDRLVYLDKENEEIKFV